jgi:hypothetical protein
MAKDEWAEFRTYLSPKASRAETFRRQQIEQAIRTRAEIERVADQQSARGRMKTPEPPI